MGVIKDGVTWGNEKVESHGVRRVWSRMGKDRVESDGVRSQMG